MVENAIIHGAFPKKEECMIYVSAYSENNRLVLNVYDNGVGMTNETLVLLKTKAGQTGHIGLLNIQERLYYIYGSNYSFDISSEQGNFTNIMIKTPLIHTKDASLEEKMIRIMIVEDDLLTRIGIASMLKARSSRFEVVAEADNGKTGLEIALNEKPDIIITDVKMPLMNGIELIYAAKKEGLKSRFVILSSYNDFEYVRDGMQLGAEDYLLKLELEENKLISLLDQIALKIESDPSPHTPSQIIIPEGAVRNDHSKARCIYNIVTGSFVSQKIIRNALMACGLSIPEKNLICIIASRQHGVSDSYAAAQTLKTLLGLLNNYGEGYGCIVDTNLFCLVASLNALLDQPLTGEYCVKIKQDFISYIKNTLDIHMLISISDPLNSFNDVSAFFSHNCIYENNHYCLADNMSNNENNYNFGAELSLLETVLHNTSLDDIGKSFDALLDSINKHDIIPSEVLHSICYILLYFLDKFFNNHTYFNPDWSRSSMILQLNKSCKKPDDYINYIISLKNMLLASIESGKNHNITIVKAKQYIENNYSKDISLDEVSGSIISSPAISAVFSAALRELALLITLPKYALNMQRNCFRQPSKKLMKSAKAWAIEIHIISAAFSRRKRDLRRSITERKADR